MRKFYQTTAEKVMKSINVEITMGHNIGITTSYYKPNEKEILNDYLKAVNLLTFSQNDKILDIKVKELQEQNKNTDYIIKGKLQEKDEEIKDLRDQFSSMKNMLESLVKGLSETKDQPTSKYPCTIVIFLWHAKISPTMTSGRYPKSSFLFL